jgi:nucleoside-diphosphate-sugar epimerase
MLHLITGGSGFVGSNIARLLAARGEGVRVLDLWRADDVPTSAEFVHADINDAAAVKKAMRGVDYVHHNVALVPLSKAGNRYWAVNVDGTRVALEAARESGVKMFAHMSSSAVFGSPLRMPITNGTPRLPIEIYGRAKKAGEDLVLKAMSEGMSASIIRPRTVIGTGRLGIFEILFDWIRDGANIFIIGKGNELFQFIHVDDIAMASIQSCLLNKPGAYNLGALEFSTLREDLESLCRHAGSGSRVESLPVAPTICALRMLDKMGLSPLSPWHYLTYHKPFHFDSASCYETLHYQPEFSNRRMMTESYDWFVNHFDVRKVKSDASSHRRPVKQGVLRLLKALS